MFDLEDVIQVVRTVLELVGVDPDDFDESEETFEDFIKSLLGG